MERITINFEPLAKFGLSEADGPRILKEYKEKDAIVAFDKRNSIICINPTLDVQCYLNYIMYLDSHYSEWVGCGYMDMGLVPILMCPSFMADTIQQQVYAIAQKWDCSIYALRAVSFLNRGYVGATKDIWVKKEDLAKILKVPVEQATLKNLLCTIGGKA